jgi:hypothetical protein
MIAFSPTPSGRKATPRALQSVLDHIEALVSKSGEDS